MVRKHIEIDEDAEELAAAWSGDDSDVDEAVEPDNEEEAAGREGHTKGKVLGDKGKNTDCMTEETVILCDFYKQFDDDDVTLSIPRLPNVATNLGCDNPQDYADFEDKISGWIQNTDKRKKLDLKKLPNPKKKFPCLKCEWSFDSAAKLSRHKEVHRHPGIYACQICFTLFQHSHNLYNHWRTTCSQVAALTSDAVLKSSTVTELRKLVLCALGSANRAQQYHVFGGAIYVPSKWFLSHKYNIIDPQYQTTCHLCHLTVPTKFLECHGDVHRGRFRMDGTIYGEYFCNICASVFRHKENLLLHWRHDCAEVVYNTPEDVLLDDEETVALAWLVLQTSISQNQMVEMARNFSLMVEGWARKHAEKNGYSKIIDRYYHFPQEIWPLPLNVGLDVLEDSLPIVGPLTFVKMDEKRPSLKNPRVPVHMTNLLAMIAPDFYSTGKAFTEFCSRPHDDVKAPRTIYKIVLRYTVQGSVIPTYKINARTCPSLRPNKVLNTKFQPSDFDVEPEFKQVVPANKKEGNKMPDTERYVYNSSWTCDARYNMGLERARKPTKTCVICHRILMGRCPREHWEEECVPLSIIVEDKEERKYIDEKLIQAIGHHLSKLPAKVKYEWPKRKDDRNQVMKETPDRIGEIRKISFIISEQNLKKLRNGLRGEIGAAKIRWEARIGFKESFKPITAPVIVCPHCGGRFHNQQFFSHLENRHFYPSFKETDPKPLEDWKRQKCHDTWHFVFQLIQESEEPIEMSLLSEGNYENCIDSFTNDAFNEEADPMEDGPTRAHKLTPWTAEPTIRAVDLMEPLVVLDDGRDHKSAHAPEPLEDRTVWHPDNTVSLLNLNRGWTEAPEHDAQEDDPFVDPFTRKPLAEPLVEVMKAATEEFFRGAEDICREMGINIPSMGVFKQPNDPKFVRKEANGEEEEEPMAYEDLKSESESEMEEEEGAEQEPPSKKKKHKEDKENDKNLTSFEKALAYEDNPRCTQYRNELRKEEKAKKDKISRAANEGVALPADPSKPPKSIDRNILFPTPLAKQDQLQYLSKVRMPDADTYPDKEVNSAINALSVEHENLASDFRVSGVHFKRYYENLPHIADKRQLLYTCDLSAEEFEGAETWQTFMARFANDSQWIIVDKKRGFNIDILCHSLVKGEEPDTRKFVIVVLEECYKKFTVFTSRDCHGVYNYYIRSDLVDQNPFEPRYRLIWRPSDEFKAKYPGLTDFTPRRRKGKRPGGVGEDDDDYEDVKNGNGDGSESLAAEDDPIRLMELLQRNTELEDLFVLRKSVEFSDDQRVMIDIELHDKMCARLDEIQHDEDTNAYKPWLLDQMQWVGVEKFLQSHEDEIGEQVKAYLRGFLEGGKRRENTVAETREARAIVNEMYRQAALEPLEPEKFVWADMSSMELVNAIREYMEVFKSRLSVRSETMDAVKPKRRRRRVVYRAPLLPENPDYYPPGYHEMPESDKKTALFDSHQRMLDRMQRSIESYDDSDPDYDPDALGREIWLKEPVKYDKSVYDVKPKVSLFAANLDKTLFTYKSNLPRIPVVEKDELPEENAPFEEDLEPLDYDYPALPAAASPPAKYEVWLPPHMRIDNVPEAPHEAPRESPVPLGAGLSGAPSEAYEEPHERPCESPEPFGAAPYEPEYEPPNDEPVTSRAPRPPGKYKSEGPWLPPHMRPGAPQRKGKKEPSGPWIPPHMRLDDAKPAGRKSYKSLEAVVKLEPPEDISELPLEQRQVLRKKRYEEVRQWRKADKRCRKKEEKRRKKRIEAGLESSEASEEASDEEESEEEEEEPKKPEIDFSTQSSFSKPLQRGKKFSIHAPRVPRRFKTYAPKYVPAHLQMRESTAPVVGFRKTPLMPLHKSERLWLTGTYVDKLTEEGEPVVEDNDKREDLTLEGPPAKIPRLDDNGEEELRPATPEEDGRDSPPAKMARRDSYDPNDELESEIELDLELEERSSSPGGWDRGAFSSDSSRDDEDDFLYEFGKKSLPLEKKAIKQLLKRVDPFDYEKKKNEEFDELYPKEFQEKLPFLKHVDVAANRGMIGYLVRSARLLCINLEEERRARLINRNDREALKATAERIKMMKAAEKKMLEDALQRIRSNNTLLDALLDAEKAYKKYMKEEHEVAEDREAADLEQKRLKQLVRDVMKSLMKMQEKRQMADMKRRNDIEYMKSLENHRSKHIMERALKRLLRRLRSPSPQDPRGLKMEIPTAPELAQGLEEKSLTPNRVSRRRVPECASEIANKTLLGTKPRDSRSSSTLCDPTKPDLTVEEKRAEMEGGRDAEPMELDDSERMVSRRFMSPGEKEDGEIYDPCLAMLDEEDPDRTPSPAPDFAPSPVEAAAEVPRGGQQSVRAEEQEAVQVPPPVETAAETIVVVREVTTFVEEDVEDSEQAVPEGPAKPKNEILELFDTLSLDGDGNASPFTEEANTAAVEEAPVLTFFQQKTDKRRNGKPWRAPKPVEKPRPGSLIDVLDHKIQAKTIAFERKQRHQLKQLSKSVSTELEALLKAALEKKDLAEIAAKLAAACSVASAKHGTQRATKSDTSKTATKTAIEPEADTTETKTAGKSGADTSKTDTKSAKKPDADATKSATSSGSKSEAAKTAKTDTKAAKKTDAQATKPDNKTTDKPDAGPVDPSKMRKFISETAPKSRQKKSKTKGTEHTRRSSKAEPKPPAAPVEPEVPKEPPRVIEYITIDSDDEAGVETAVVNVKREVDEEQEEEPMETSEIPVEAEPMEPEAPAPDPEAQAPELQAPAPEPEAPAPPRVNEYITIDSDDEPVAVNPVTIKQETAEEEEPMETSEPQPDQAPRAPTPKPIQKPEKPKQRTLRIYGGVLTVPDHGDDETNADYDRHFQGQVTRAEFHLKLYLKENPHGPLTYAALSEWRPRSFQTNLYRVARESLELRLKEIAMERQRNSEVSRLEVRTQAPGPSARQRQESRPENTSVPRPSSPSPSFIRPESEQKKIIRQQTPRPSPRREEESSDEPRSGSTSSSDDGMSEDSAKRKKPTRRKASCRLTPGPSHRRSSSGEPDSSSSEKEHAFEKLARQKKFTKKTTATTRSDSSESSSDDHETTGQVKSALTPSRSSHRTGEPQKRANEQDPSAPGPSDRPARGPDTSAPGPSDRPVRRPDSENPPGTLERQSRARDGSRASVPLNITGPSALRTSDRPVRRPDPQNLLAPGPSDRPADLMDFEDSSAPGPSDRPVRRSDHRESSRRADTSARPIAENPLATGPSSRISRPVDSSGPSARPSASKPTPTPSRPIAVESSAPGPSEKPSTSTRTPTRPMTQDSSAPGPSPKPSAPRRADTSNERPPSKISRPLDPSGPSPEPTAVTRTSSRAIAEDPSAPRPSPRSSAPSQTNIPARPIAEESNQAPGPSQRQSASRPTPTPLRPIAPDPSAPGLSQGPSASTRTPSRAMTQDSSAAASLSRPARPLEPSGFSQKPSAPRPTPTPTRPIAEESSASGPPSKISRPSDPSGPSAKPSASRRADMSSRPIAEASSASGPSPIPASPMNSSDPALEQATTEASRQADIPSRPIAVKSAALGPSPGPTASTPTSSRAMTQDSPAPGPSSRSVRLLDPPGPSQRPSASRPTPTPTRPIAEESSASGPPSKISRPSDPSGPSPKPQASRRADMPARPVAVESSAPGPSQRPSASRRANTSSKTTAQDSSAPGPSAKPSASRRDARPARAIAVESAAPGPSPGPTASTPTSLRAMPQDSSAPGSLSRPVRPLDPSGPTQRPSASTPADTSSRAVVDEVLREPSPRPASPMDTSDVNLDESMLDFLREQANARVEDQPSDQEMDTLDTSSRPAAEDPPGSSPMPATPQDPTEPSQRPSDQETDALEQSTLEFLRRSAMDREEAPPARVLEAPSGTSDVPQRPNAEASASDAPPRQAPAAPPQPSIADMTPAERRARLIAFQELLRQADQFMGPAIDLPDVPDFRGRRDDTPDDA